MFIEAIGGRTQNMISISMFNSQHNCMEFCDNLVKKDRDLYVDNEYDVHMSSRTSVKSGYVVDLDLLTSLY